MRGDHVDVRQAQWRREFPDIDTVGMAILGRMRWITQISRPRIEEVFMRHGLDTGTFDVLATLLRAGHPYTLRPTELYEQLMISSGGLTDRLRRLSKAGLIQRQPAQDDGRSLLVRLTEKGKALAEEAFREDMAVEREILATLSNSDQELIVGLLRKLALSIGEREAHASSSMSQ